MKLHEKFISSVLAMHMMTLMGCDESATSGVGEVHAIEGGALARTIAVEVRDLDDVEEQQSPLFTDERSAESPSAEGPAGMCCFVHCGGTGYYENLWWVQHNCNGVGWDWCAGHYGTSLINAEWWGC